MLYGPLVAVIRLFIVLIQLQRSCQILKHFTHFVSELQRFQSRLFHKCPITIETGTGSAHGKTALSALPHFAICLGWQYLNRAHNEPIFNFLSALTKSSQPFFVQFIGTFLNAFRATFFAFCLVWFGLVWARLVCTGTLALVLVTGLGHCLLPFPVRGAAYANIFNMIAFLYFDFMRSLCCVFPSLQGVGGGRGPHMSLI